MKIQFGSLMNKNSTTSHESAANINSDPQHSGIRASTGKKKTELKSTSTLMPCQHCTDEMNDKDRRIPRVRTCYYHHQPGHQIYSCQKKETDEATQLIRQAVNTGIQKQEGVISDHQEMIVVGTEGGLWSDIWYVSSVFTRHIAGNLNVFKRIKHIVRVDTQSGGKKFLFTRGFGSVEIKTSNEIMRIQSVFYSPELDRNVLSMDQLTLQGYTVNKSGDTCRIYPMFSTPINNSVNEVSGLTREEEIGLSEKQGILDVTDYDDEFKERYLNSYFEELNLSSQETDLSLMIVKAMEFHEFADCKAFLDMIDDRGFVFKYKHTLEAKFEEMVKWFLNVYMGMSSRPVPPYAPNKRKIDMLGLYALVGRDGGYRDVTSENIWPVIAKDYMRIIYAMYLDILEYYYKFKSVQEKVHDKKMVNEEEGPSLDCHVRRKSAGDIHDDAASAHYALFARNGWEDDWNLQRKRKRFNFNHMRKAVEDAKQSVMQPTSKHN